MENIIWEADEDCDQCLTWDEFVSMYNRGRNDQTGEAQIEECLINPLQVTTRTANVRNLLRKRIQYSAQQVNLTGN